MAGTKRDFALIKHGHLFAELDDIDLAGVVDNSLIQYNSATGNWEDITLANLNGQLDHGLLLGNADDDHTQYHTDARALTWLGTRSTTDLPEGSRLYYTDERAQDAVGLNLVDSASIDFTYNDGAGTFTAVVLPAGVDHGGLAGLGDDDHPQYPLAGSTETITGAWTFNTTPVVPDDSWTYAKIQNVSATNRILGRITSGSGDIEELTAANVATILAGITQTWTETHLFNKVWAGATIGTLAVRSTGPVFELSNTTSGTADQHNVFMYPTSVGFNIDLRSDDYATSRIVMSFQRAGVALTEVIFGNPTDLTPSTFYGHMRMTDGVTAPSTAAGFAAIYVDAADGDLKVKFGDGTVKTIVVDT